MSQENLEALKDTLEQKQKELDLVLAIDHIRDSAPNPTAMLVSIVTVLAKQLEAQLCLLSLIDRETGQIELKAINDRTQHDALGHIITPKLAEQATNLDAIAIWDKERLGVDMAEGPEKLQVAAVPVIMGKNERLGALLLLRTGSHFSQSEIKLLDTAESMIDSAVIQGYADHELKQRVKELETIYRIDQIRDQGLPFDEMLNVVLQEVCKAIDAEAGFFMLYAQTGQQLELRAATTNDLFQISSHYETISRLSNESLEKTELICHNHLGQGLHSLMCLPLILNEEIIGVLGIANSRSSHGFSGDDRRLLRAIGSQTDTAIFESMERRRLRQVLGRSVDPHVMERLLANPDVEFLKGERAVLSVLYADLRGSTQLAENTDPELLVGFINHYLGQMTDVILSYEGTLDKFVGDEVMALFGAPFPQEDHALRAVRVALDMQKAHQNVLDIWQQRGLTPTPIGIGIATGELVVGEMGSPQRADYTVIGNAANLGARICSAAKGGEVLISPETYDLVQDSVDATPIDDLHFKGVSRGVTVYKINRVLA